MSLQIKDILFSSQYDAISVQFFLSYTTFISLIDNRRTTSDDDVNLSDELDFKILSKEQYIQENINNLIDLYDDSAETRESKIQAVQDIISLLTAKCQQLIWGKYRDHIAMKDLAELLGLKNANVAKTSLSRCLDQFEINFKKRIKQGKYGSRDQYQRRHH